MFETLSDDQILRELGRRFEQRRLAARIADRDVFSGGGVKKDALAHFKKGKSVTLLNFIKILRGANLLDRLEQLFPESPAESPMMQITRSLKSAPKRIRARKPLTLKPPFEWGEP